MVTEGGESAHCSPAGDLDPLTLSENVRIGRLEGLRSLRDTLANEIEHPPKSVNSAIPALARQLRDTLSEIASLEKDLPQGSVVDDLASRRDFRRSQVAEGVTLPAGDEGQLGS